MLDYAHLEALLAVEREGSFEGAARSLGVTSSAISQRIKLLEERLGAVTVNRQVPIKPTKIGVTLCRHAEMVSMLEENILRSNDSIGSGNQSAIKVKIIVNDDSLSSWFMDVLMANAQSDSSYMFEISITDQDYSIDEIKLGTALAAISVNKEPVQGFCSTFLGMHVYRATASPDFIEQYFPNGVNLEGLRQSPALRYSAQDDLQQQWIEQVFGETIIHDSHILPSSCGFVSACLRGIAWGMNPALMVDKYLGSGELVELVPDTVLNKPLYWHCSRLIAEPLQEFTNRVKEVAHEQLDQSSRSLDIFANKIDCK